MKQGRQKMSVFSRKTFARFLAASCIVGAASLGSSLHASAGSNGQQFTLYVAAATNSVFLSGTNQNGQPASGCFNTPVYPYGNNISGYYWVGNVLVAYYQHSGCADGTYTHSQTINVPKVYQYDYYGVVEN